VSRSSWDREAIEPDRSRVAASSRSRCGGLCGQRDFQMQLPGRRALL